MAVIFSSSSSSRHPRSILGACLVPWRSDGTCDESLFRRTVAHSIRTLSPDLYIFGTAGEGYAVTDRQFEAIVRLFVAEMHAAATNPMVGVISLSLGTVVERIEFARSLGVRLFQISLPAWGALDDVEVDRFFAATCGRFRDCSFLHYNLARTKRLLTGADYGRLAARHPNLVAIKMGGEDLAALREVAAAAPGVRCYFTEFGYIALRDETDCGLLCALGACEPSLARRLFAAKAAGRAALEPIFRALHRAAKAALGGAAHMDGAYDKMYVKRHFPEFPLGLLPPYSGATDEQFAAFRDATNAILEQLPHPVTSEARNE